MTNQIQMIYRLEELCHPDTLQLIKLFLESHSETSDIDINTDINNEQISLPLFHAHLIKNEPLHEKSNEIANQYLLNPYETFIVDQLINQQKNIYNIYKSKPNVKTNHSIYKTTTNIYIEVGDTSWNTINSLQIFLQKQKKRFLKHI